MRVVELISRKRRGGELSSAELQALVHGYCTDEIPDYQMAAWAMAVCFQGLNGQETAALTLAMAHSGDRVDLSDIAGVKVDKHSTGGVGDKTTLIVAPLVAAAGVPVAKMSGRGLGYTGGTIDKLEAIPGMQTALAKEAFIRQVNTIGLALVSQSGNLTPADKKLYALRDVTATVESIPLIASSIMSKKIAAGADRIVLDVKVGSGAFMKTLAEAEALAEAMVEIGHQVGRPTTALISDMNEPLGYGIGNALEVAEAIRTLQGQGPADLTELCLVLGAHMVVLGEKASTLAEARALLERLLHNGMALEKFREFVLAQGGNERVVDDPERVLPQAAYQIELKSEHEGRLSAIATEEVGLVAMRLGAGRATKQDSVDPAAGLVLARKCGDWIRKGDLLATVYASKSGEQLQPLMEELRQAFRISGAGAEREAEPAIKGVTVREVEHGAEFTSEGVSRSLLLSVVTREGVQRL